MAGPAAPGSGALFWAGLLLGAVTWEELFAAAREHDLDRETVRAALARRREDR